MELLNEIEGDVEEGWELFVVIYLHRTSGEVEVSRRIFGIFNFEKCFQLEPITNIEL